MSYVIYDLLQTFIIFFIKKRCKYRYIYAEEEERRSKMQRFLFTLSFQYYYINARHINIDNRPVFSPQSPRCLHRLAIISKPPCRARWKRDSYFTRITFTIAGNRSYLDNDGLHPGLNARATRESRCGHS